MSEGGRNARFVRTAKTMLLFQVGAGAAATAVAAWAVFGVADLARERDALAARVEQLEAIVPPELLPPAPEPDAVPEALLADEPAPVPDADAIADPILNKIERIDPPPRPTVACLRYDRVWSQCPLPLERVDGRFCIDVRGADAFCPDVAIDNGGSSGSSGGSGGVENKIDPPPPPPPPARDCQSVDRRPIVCVPPFTRTPVPGVCTDGNRRPMRCPRGQRIEEPDPSPNDAARR